MATMKEYQEALAYADKQRTEAEMLKPVDFSSKVITGRVQDDGACFVYFDRDEDAHGNNYIESNEIPQFLDFCRWVIATFGEE